MKLVLESREDVLACLFVYPVGSFQSVKAFDSFGLCYICSENDDLMVFQMLCNRRFRAKGGGVWQSVKRLNTCCSEKEGNMESRGCHLAVVQEEAEK